MPLSPFGVVSQPLVPCRNCLDRLSKTDTVVLFPATFWLVTIESSQCRMKRDLNEKRKTRRRNKQMESFTHALLLSHIWIFMYLQRIADNARNTINYVKYGDFYICCRRHNFSLTLLRSLNFYISILKRLSPLKLKPKIIYIDQTTLYFLYIIHIY